MLIFRITNWSQSVKSTDNPSDNKDPSSILSFLLFTPFAWRETYLFTRQVKVQSRENTLIIIITKETWQICEEVNTFSSISSFTDRVLFRFQRKMNGPNPLKMDITVTIRAPTQKIIINKRTKRLSIKGKYWKIHQI